MKIPSESDMVSTISKNVSHNELSYQGNPVDPPSPLSIEHKAQEAATTTPDVTNPCCCSRLFQTLKLEIVGFIFTFSLVLTRISSSSMILDKVCLAHFGYPPDVCGNLQNHTALKTQIERLSTNYQLGHTLIQTAPAALLSCFVGPWSDRYGRKTVVSVALVGMILDNLGSAACAHFLDSRVEYYYIPALFTGAFGGVVSLLAVVYSYASDLTPFNQRTVKYALLEMATGVAIPMGAASGGWIYNFFGYTPVFLLSASGMFGCLLWVRCLLPETRGLDNKDSWRVKWKDFFSCKTFKESFIATAKSRPHQGRKQIVLLIASMCFIVVATNSTGDISYLYVHHQFNWGNTEYSTITAIYSVCAIFLLIVVVPLFKKYKAGDPALGIIGSASTMVKFLGIGVAWNTTVFHMANLLGLLSACAPLAARSRISKVVSNDDLGKVFSFVATAESLLPVLTTILISQLFNAFITIYPGIPYIILAVMLILPFSVFSWMAYLPVLNYEDIHRKNNKKEEYISIEA